MARSRLARTIVSAAAGVAVLALGGRAAPHLLAQTAPGTTAQQVFDPSAYLPSAGELTTALHASPLHLGDSYNVTAAPAPPTSWDAAARYLVAYRSGSPAYIFDIAVSVYPSQLAAAVALNQTAGDLLAENSPSREYPQAAGWNDHAREVRYNFTDPDTGAADGSYTEILREGCALALVNAHGRPVPDFTAPAVDNDRGLLLGVVYQAVDARLQAMPAPCPGDASDPPMPVAAPAALSLPASVPTAPAE